MKRTSAFLALFLMGTASFVWGLETIIKGGEMELLKKGEEVLFKKGVKLTRGSDTLKAREMRTNKKRDRVRVKGKVSLIRRVSSTETWKGFGQKGFYDTKSGKGYLLGGWKRAHVVYLEVVSATSTKKIDIYSKRFDFSENGQDSVAKGDVYGKYIEPGSGRVDEFWSEEAYYTGADKKIVLKGKKQPEVKQTLDKDVKTIRGDVITFYVETNDFIAEGEAEAILIEPKQKENKK